MDNKIKSPFLSEENSESGSEQKANVSGEQTESENLSGPEGQATGFQKTEGQKSELSYAPSSSSENKNNNNQSTQTGEVIEIKEEGKWLRRVVIIIIILLLLALLGAGLFYVLQLKKSNSGPNEDINIQEDQSSIGVGNFEMEGDEFGADSVVVDN